MGSAQNLEKIARWGNLFGLFMIENTGVRLIYFNVLEDGLIVMSYFYAKNEQENISLSELQKLKR